MNGDPPTWSTATDNHVYWMTFVSYFPLTFEGGVKVSQLSIASAVLVLSTIRSSCNVVFSIDVHLSHHKVLAYSTPLTVTVAYLRELYFADVRRINKKPSSRIQSAQLLMLKRSAIKLATNNCHQHTIKNTLLYYLSRLSSHHHVRCIHCTKDIF